MVKNILSVDVEDWYHICGINDRLTADNWDRLESRVEINTLKIIDILRRKSVRATFFVLGYVAEKHPDLVKEIQTAGHEIACHGYAHQRVYTMPPDAFRRDVVNASEILYKITGCSVKGYRAPEWSIRDDSLWALDILQQEGYTYDSSMAPLAVIGNQNYPVTHHKLPLAQGHLWEFPPLVAKTQLGNLPLGGGWGLRIFPYRLIRSSIRRLNQQGRPALIYIHPRELDRNNPRLRLPLAKKFVLDARLATTENRLARLLDDFKFTTVADFLI